MQSDRPYTCLLILLRLALGEHTDTMLPSLTADEWREVYQLSVKHAVVALAWEGVEQLQLHIPEALQAMPADLMGKFLNDGGFDSQVLKGSTLAACYPNPEHRQGKITATVEFTDAISKDDILVNLKRMPFHPTYITHQFTPYTYPIQTNSTRQMIKCLKQELAKSNFYMTGRFADWEYYNMDVAMAAAMKLCETM